MIPAPLRILFSKHYWSSQFSSKKFLSSFFAVCGVGATGVEAVQKLAEIFKDANQPNLVTPFISAHHWAVVSLIALVALIIALGLLLPTTKVNSRLKQRDLNIRIEVGDLFATDHTLVIGTNTTFDTEINGGVIHPNSLQGQFTRRYFGTAIHHLDADLDLALEGAQFAELTEQEKRRGKRRKFEMGTVAKISVEGRDAYLVAMANMNGHAVASTTIEDVRVALSSLWLYISEKGGGLPSLRVPILGTGFGKLVQTRQDVIHEILRSLVAACASDRFCEQFTLVISVKDFIDYQIDLNELGRFLEYLTTYTEVRSATDVGGGAPLPD